MYTSNVCRVSEAVIKAIAAAIEVKPGVNPIPVEILEPRQVKLLEACGNVPTVSKRHRGERITVIARGIARELVRDGVAEYLPQGLLVYTMEDYLADKDVIADPEEHAKAKASGDTLVAVATVGDNRSALTVCRNIVSGCQNPDRLKSDAQGALDASDILLVE